MAEIKALGATDNVKVNLAPKDKDGKDTKFDSATPPAFTATAGTVDETGLVVLPVDFTSDSAPILVTATYKELSYNLTINGGDAEVADLGATAEVVKK